MQNRPIVLASQSPRRKQLLSSLNIDFDVIVADVEENMHPNLDFEHQIQLIAMKKALAVYQQVPQSLVIAGDTLVICENQVLGKPKNQQEAFEMLKFIMNKQHQVISGVCLIDDEILTYSVTSEVVLKDVSDEIIWQYLDLCQPLDKAGAYGIQDNFFQTHFLDSIIGEYENIMGLPLIKLKEILIQKEVL